MIFTHCEYACPRLIQDIKALRAAIPESVRADVHTLLISMDSERDTPAVLRTYAQDNELEPGAWTLLHGTDPVIRELAALTGVRYKRGIKGNFSHSNRITLLDPAGSIVERWDGLGIDEQSASASVVEHLNKAK